MIRVREVMLRELFLPLRTTFRTSRDRLSERRSVLVRIRSERGVAVWSECVAFDRPTYSAETVDTAWLALRQWLVPALLAGPIDGPGAVAARLAGAVRGHPMARAALEMGVWALEAEHRSISLARLLGGTRPRVPVGISMGIAESPAQQAERARVAVARGYRRIKVKIEPGTERSHLWAVRQAVGPDVAVSADANGSYARGAGGRLRALDDLGLSMLEQPFPPGDLVRHARLQRTMRTPLCLDESVDGPARARDMILLRSARVLNIKPGRVGGLTAARRIHNLCHARGIPVWCGGMLETGIGRAYNVALASLPGFSVPSDLSPSRRYWARDIVSPEWTMDAGGWVAVPVDRPGLGVDIDLDRIDDLTTREVVMGV